MSFLVFVCRVRHLLGTNQANFCFIFLSSFLFSCPAFLYYCHLINSLIIFADQYRSLSAISTIALSIDLCAFLSLISIDHVRFLISHSYIITGTRHSLRFMFSLHFKNIGKELIIILLFFFQILSNQKL